MKSQDSIQQEQRSTILASYDETPYPDLSYVQTHPDRLATLGLLLGIDAAPVAQCRVLELGCASGGNLLPMAYHWPDATFVGVDNSQRQIEAAMSRVQRAELNNVRFLAEDITQLSQDLGPFDYIIAHGVYSWVPADVRDALLSKIKVLLAVHGIAYVSYNTYPGWHITGLVRDAMLYRTRNSHSPATRVQQAREFLRFLSESISEQNSAYAGVFTRYLAFLEQDMKGNEDAFLLHDELEAVNDPVYFYRFVEHAAGHGLQYLADAELSTAIPQNMGNEVASKLQKLAHDAIEIEQYMDFLRNRMFRQTLLCHDNAQTTFQLRPENIMKCLVAARTRERGTEARTKAGTVVEFHGSDGAKLSTDHPVTQASMRDLANIWPAAVPFQTLLQRAVRSAARKTKATASNLQLDAQILAANLLRAYGHSSRFIELHAALPSFAEEVSATPEVSSVARLEAQSRALVTNAWHGRVKLTEFQRQVVLLCDGTRDLDTLQRDLVARLVPHQAVNEQDDGATHKLTHAAIKADLAPTLQWLRRSALLVS